MTRSDFMIKWGVYALAILPIWFLEVYVLNRLPVLGVTPMLMPLAAVAAAVLEGATGGAGYGLFVGILCDAAYHGTNGAMTLGLCLLGMAAGALAQYALRQNLVRDTLLRAANNIRFGDRRSVLGAIAARPELFGAETYAPRWHPLLKRPLLDRILKGRECRTLLYLRIALRRSSLRLRGRFNA